MGADSKIEWTDATWTPVRARNRSTGKVVDRKRLEERLSYDRETGLFIWRMARADKIGAIAGKREHHGYIQIVIDGRAYMAHRLAWLWQTGGWPLREIDHVNGHKDDNTWNNLREATRSQNCINKPPQPGASGVVGNA